MSLLILKEKHGDRYFSFSDEKEFGLLALYIVRERNEEGWYDGLNEKGVQLKGNALQGDATAAIAILSSRTGCEYEDYEIGEPQTVKGLKL
jgi:hypothetical protein